jgi:hypothetical protein
MIRRHTKTAIAGGGALGAAHFAAICGLAAMVVREQHTGASQEFWQYAAIFDLPVNLVLLLLSPLVHLLSGVANWPDVAFLPGIIGSWNKFLLPFLFYGVLGTLVWFLIGWSFVRIGGSRYAP